MGYGGAISASRATLSARFDSFRLDSDVNLYSCLAHELNTNPSINTSSLTTVLLTQPSGSAAMTIAGKLAIGGTLFLCGSYYLEWIATLSDLGWYTSYYSLASFPVWWILAVFLPALGEGIGELLKPFMIPLMILYGIYWLFLGDDSTSSYRQREPSFLDRAWNALPEFPFDVDEWVWECATILFILWIALPGVDLILIGFTLLAAVVALLRAERVKIEVQAHFASERTRRLQQMIKDNSHAYKKAITRTWEWHESKVRLLELRPGAFDDPLEGTLTEHALQSLKKEDAKEEGGKEQDLTDGSSQEADMKNEDRKKERVRKRDVMKKYLTKKNDPAMKTPSYIALSWAWGDLIETGTITVNGTQFTIPINAFEMLRRVKDSA